MLLCTLSSFPICHNCAANNFPSRDEYSLLVEAHFNKECLVSDPIPHVGEKLDINTELAWEMFKKSLQQHKLNRTPIKIQVGES